jgi:hypothetical protein
MKDVDPQLTVTTVTPEQLVNDELYKTYEPTSADGAIVGEALAAKLPDPPPLTEGENDLADEFGGDGF